MTFDIVAMGSDTPAIGGDLAVMVSDAAAMEFDSDATGADCPAMRPDVTAMELDKTAMGSLQRSVSRSRGINFRSGF